MLTAFFYNVLLFILAIIALPKTLYHRLRYGKYKESLSKKMGIDFPKIEKGKNKLVWIHACSVGETKAIIALAKLIKNETNALLVISSTTETGHMEAKKSLPFADYHVYLPLDFSPIIGPIVKQTAPDLVLLSESEFWFNFLRISKNVGAVTAVVNGKISQRSLSRFLWYPSFAKKLFGYIDYFCVQNELYAQRFQALGIDPKKIEITGNLKFDESYTKTSVSDLEQWKEELGISSKNKVLVIGSSHDPEERLLLSVLEPVWTKFPELKVLIVPRHTERSSDVAQLIEKKGLSYIRMSEMSSKTEEENERDRPSIEAAQVILVDKMGILRKCYQIADAAIVGGSYTPRVGGHNIIEPPGYGVPVIFGPYMHTQTELVELVNKSGAGVQLEIDRVAPVLIQWFEKPEKRVEIGEKGRKLVENMTGGTLKTWNILKHLVDHLNS